VIFAHRSGPSASKNACTVASDRPGAAHTNRPLSWSTTTTKNNWPRRYEISSIPIRLSPSSRSVTASISATTRAMIAPTVRHWIRINSHTALFDVFTASHATWSSNSRVCLAP